MAVFALAGSVIVPIARAIAGRIAHGAPDRLAGGEAQALREDVEQLRAELESMQGRVAQLDEIQERLDFAERLLAQARTKGALPGAS